MCFLHSKVNTVCGATQINVLSWLLKTGGDGNLAIFRNCHFLMNRGLTEGFGVAVAISSSIFFRNTESLPRHDFTNW